jgi:hypothetical protein
MGDLELSVCVPTFIEMLHQTLCPGQHKSKSHWPAIPLLLLNVFHQLLLQLSERSPCCETQCPAIASAKASDVEERALSQNSIAFFFGKSVQHTHADAEFLHDGSFGVWIRHALHAMLAESQDNLFNRSLT